MKDKKFVTVCVLMGIWIAIFVAMLFGVRIHPRVEQLVTVLLIGWVAFWTLSIVFSKNQTNPIETNKNESPTKIKNSK